VAYDAARYRAAHELRGQSLNRKLYLDWLRGVAVIVMVGAHVTDAWTLSDDRHGRLHTWTVFVAGMASPLFLFLAGLTLSMAASTRADSVGHDRAAALARKRGLQIFALAFLFRLQSQLLGWGALSNFLKVDILNVMGLAMLGASLLWGLSRSRIVRIGLFAAATTAIAMSTPLVREWGALAVLPDPIEAYIRPLPGRTNFALFPWAAFVFGGAITGELVRAARTERQERRLQDGFAIAGLLGLALAYAAALLPSIYAVSNFWTSSPTFFFMRLGYCTMMLPLAWNVDRFHAYARRLLPALFTEPDVPGRVITTLGRSSLFVYWIHVEMVYGGIALPLKRALPLELALVATVALCALLYLITRWKDRKMREVQLGGPFRILAPVLK
jgi:uncharacterized membrane protein